MLLCIYFVYVIMLINTGMTLSLGLVVILDARLILRILINFWIQTFWKSKYHRFAKLFLT